MKTPTRMRGRRIRWIVAVLTAALLAAAPAANARPERLAGAPVRPDKAIVVQEADGFDWADAGIGAGAAAGLVLLGVATSRIVRRHRGVAAIRPGQA
jgi:hypothetical protein